MLGQKSRDHAYTLTLCWLISLWGCAPPSAQVTPASSYSPPPNIRAINPSAPAEPSPPQPIRPRYSDPDWRPVASSETCVAFVDKNMIKPSGNIIIIWTQYDCTPPQKFDKLSTYMSIISMRKVDCINAKHSNITNTYYSGPHGSGKVLDIFQYSYDKWEYVLPGTVAAGVLDAVCNNDF